MEESEYDRRRPGRDRLAPDRERRDGPSRDERAARRDGAVEDPRTRRQASPPAGSPVVRQTPAPGVSAERRGVDRRPAEAYDPARATPHHPDPRAGGPPRRGAERPAAPRVQADPRATADPRAQADPRDRLPQQRPPPEPGSPDRQPPVPRSDERRPSDPLDRGRTMPPQSGGRQDRAVSPRYARPATAAPKPVPVAGRREPPPSAPQSAAPDDAARPRRLGPGTRAGAPPAGAEPPSRAVRSYPSADERAGVRGTVGPVAPPAARTRRTALPGRGYDEADDIDTPAAGELDFDGSFDDAIPLRREPDTPEPRRAPRAAVARDEAARPDPSEPDPRRTEYEPELASAYVPADRGGGRKQRRPAPVKTPLTVEQDDTRRTVEGPIVAPHTIASRGLTVVIAIMTFLCALLVGGVLLIDRASGAWSADVLDEITVTVLPLDGDPIDTRLQRVAALLDGTSGLSDVAIVPAAQSEALLTPWLGEGVDLSALPVPRLVTARRTGPFDSAALSRSVDEVSGASLDDHTGWSERLSRMASAVSGGAIGALVLMLIATAISIVFATRSAIAANAATVEVLNLLGAEDRFVVRAFGRRFVGIGVRGAALGLAVALVLFGLLDMWSLFSSAAGSAQSRALLGDPSIGLAGYVALVLVAVGVTILVSVTSSVSVRRHLESMYH